jgi:transposase-like protein
VNVGNEDESKNRQAIRPPAERVVNDIRRATRKQYSAEDKIRIVLDGLRGEDSIAELCRREGISRSIGESGESALNPDREKHAATNS